MIAKIQKFFITSSFYKMITIRNLPYRLAAKLRRLIWYLYYKIFTNKVPFDKVVFDIAYGCNLGCDYCSRLSQFDNGFVPLEDLKYWFKTWNKKIAPCYVSLAGGEPLLHPQIDQVLAEAAKA
jgi:MoaA/NifB/PqqE/SkfB family radical SAM enzyme